MLGIGTTAKNISVLEAKFSIYEDLSKEMLDKLERAVDKISEGNNSVALILERHESRLEQADRADLALMELIKDVRHKLIELEKQVAELSKFRWITMGIATSALIVIGSASFFGNLLTLERDSAIIDGVKAPLIR